MGAYGSRCRCAAVWKTSSKVRKQSWTWHFRAQGSLEYRENWKGGGAIWKSGVAKKVEVACHDWEARWLAGGVDGVVKALMSRVLLVGGGAIGVVEGLVGEWEWHWCKERLRWARK